MAGTTKGHRVSLLVFGFFLSLSLGACGDDHVDVGSVEEARSAIIHIESWGAAVQPGSLGAQVFVRQGSGFIIDSSGLAVTSNHVVATSANIEVYIEGQSAPLPATVVARAECADLAVIAIEGHDHVALDWFDDEIEQGLPVFVAGYPNGDPEYATHAGEVLGLWPDADTQWASIESFVHHTALTSSGASGAPVLSEDGTVVAVAFAYGSGMNPNYFGVAAGLAQSTVEHLSLGHDVNSVGARTRAWTGTADASGVWVEAVDAGSPAAHAGLVAGDIIETIGGVSLLADHTLGTYCGVLRSRESPNALSLEVLRPSTGRRFVGELFGDELRVSTAAPVHSSSEYESVGGLLVAHDDHESPDIIYAPIRGDAIEVAVPQAWTETRSTEVVSETGTTLGTTLTAAASVEELTQSWAISGIQLTAVQLGEQSLEDMVAGALALDPIDGCEVARPQPYRDGGFVGTLTISTNCGETGSSLVTIAVQDQATGMALVLTAPITSTDDLETLDGVLASMRITAR